MSDAELDFGQKFNGLASVRGAKYGVREFLYCHGQAGTMIKFAAVSLYPTKCALPGAAQIGQSQAELLLKSEPVRRVEVFTGAGRRRSWTAEQKLGIVAESSVAGETVSAVARRHGMTQ